MPHLHWRRSSCAAPISLPIAIALLSHRPLCCRCCPLPLPLSIPIMPPLSIVIAAAVHLAWPPIAPLLHQWGPSIVPSRPIAHCNHFAVPPPIAPPLLPITAVSVNCNLAAAIHHNLAAANHLSLPPVVLLLPQRQSSTPYCAFHHATAIPLPIAIALPSCRPLRRLCPLMLPPSIAILLPLSIMFATAIHLALPPIAPLLCRW